MLKKMMSIVLAGTLCFSMCACGSSSDHSESSVSESADQGMKTISLENENVLAVKEAVNSHYPGDITYGDAFEEFFTDPSWKYFKGSQEGPDDDGDGEPDYTIDDIDVVEFTGGCTYQDVEVTALIQFTLDKEEGTFEAVYLSFNDVPQSTLMLGDCLAPFLKVIWKHIIFSQMIVLIQTCPQTMLIQTQMIHLIIRCHQMIMITRH